MTKYLERIAPTGHRGGRCSLYSAMQCFKWCDVYQFLIIQYLGDALKKKKKNIDHGAPVADERTKNFLWSNCQQRARMFFLTLSRLSEKTSTLMVLMKLKKHCAHGALNDGDRPPISGHKPKFHSMFY